MALSRIDNHPWVNMNEEEIHRSTGLILTDPDTGILAHRDYSNAYTAQFVIESNRIYTKNSNLPHEHGELKLNQFEPFPKNPPISKVFREIGYADESNEKIISYQNPQFMLYYTCTYALYHV